MSEQEDLDRYRYLQLKAKMAGAQQPPATNYPEVIGSAIKNAFVKPAAFAKDLGTNPESMANAMPSVLGAGGAVAMPWGGSTVGTAAGQGVRDVALTAMGKPVPSGLQHAGELGGAALGDVMAVPFLKKAHYGGEIGRVEKLAGVPGPQEIQSLPMATGAKSAGEFINDAVTSVKASGGRGTPSYWLQIKDQVDRLYKLGKTEALTGLDKGRLKWLSGKVQEGLNAAVEGRGGPAKALAESQTIPRAIGKVYKQIPPEMKKGAAYGTGAGAMGYSAYELMKKFMGG